jgi:excisionase family DNA binding protein
MQNLVFTQLSIPEVRQLLREELETYFAKAPLQPHQDTKVSPDIGGMDLAVEVTGLKKPTLYALVARREIPHMKRGKRLYFKRAELLEWIQEGRKKTAKEIEAEALEQAQGVAKGKGPKA